MPPVLVDAGALLALLDRSDAAHGAAVAALAAIHEPLATVWPALSEAVHLLRAVPRGQDTLLQMIGDEAVSMAGLDGGDIRRMHALMHKYRDVPMDFADAALVRVAERDGLSRIFSFDSHFGIYRLPNRGRFIVLGLPLLK